MKQEEMITEIKMPKFLGGEGSVKHEDLRRAWKKAGRPQDVDSLAKLLRVAGLSEKEVTRSFKTVGIPWKPTGEFKKAEARKKAKAEKGKPPGEVDPKAVQISMRLLSFLTPEQRDKIKEMVQNEVNRAGRPRAATKVEKQPEEPYEGPIEVPSQRPERKETQIQRQQAYKY